MSHALGFAERRERVGGLAGLRDGQRHGVAVDRRVAIAEFAGVFDFHRQTGQFLEEVFADQARVITGAAGGHDDAIDLAELLRR